MFGKWVEEALWSSDVWGVGAPNSLGDEDETMLIGARNLSSEARTSNHRTQSLNRQTISVVVL